MQGAFLLLNQLVAPPIGAFLFAIGMALPFGANAAAFALGAVLVSRVVTRARACASADEPAQPARGDRGGDPLARRATRRCGRWR